MCSFGNERRVQEQAQKAQCEKRQRRMEEEEEEEEEEESLFKADAVNEEDSERQEEQG